MSLISLCHQCRSAAGALFLGSALLAAGNVIGADKLLFRYTDDQGQIVLNDTLPPSAAGRGYEIIRPDGRVVKRVEPAISETVSEAARLEQEEAERRRKWDESLLLRYSDVADIEAAKKRAMSDIRVRISILKGNLSYLKTQVEREEFRAAEADRQGMEVSEELKDAIRTHKIQIGDVEELINARQAELDETAARYDRDMRRFAILLDRIGNR